MAVRVRVSLLSLYDVHSAVAARLPDLFAGNCMLGGCRVCTIKPICLFYTVDQTGSSSAMVWQPKVYISKLVCLEIFFSSYSFLKSQFYLNRQLPHSYFHSLINLLSNLYRWICKFSLMFTVHPCHCVVNFCDSLFRGSLRVFIVKCIYFEFWMFPTGSDVLCSVYHIYICLLVFDITHHPFFI